MPIVRALPSAESGRAFLELHTTFERLVRVEAILASRSGTGVSQPLLDAEIQLPSGGPPQRIDVTEKLIRLLSTTSRGKPEMQEERIQIALHLEPDSPNQTSRPYRVVLEGNRSLEFTKG